MYCVVVLENKGIDVLLSDMTFVESDEHLGTIRYRSGGSLTGLEKMQPELNDGATVVYRWGTAPPDSVVDPDFEIPDPDVLTKGILGALRTHPTLNLSGLDLAQQVNRYAGAELPSATPLRYLLLPVGPIRKLVRRNPDFIPWLTDNFDMEGIPDGRIEEFQRAIRMYTLRAKRPLNVGNVRVMSLTELMDNSNIIKGKQNAEFIKALVARPTLARRGQ